MARHAEVKEQEIIDAGVALEKSDKRANSGSIRVKLGNRGGFARIKEVWEKHINNRNAEEITVDSDVEIELPAEIQDSFERNSKQAIKNLEVITVNSFKVAQQIAEKRVSSTIEEYKAKIEDFEESEQQAGIALEACDSEIIELSDELDVLKQRYEELVACNAELKGKLSSANDNIAKLEAKETELNILRQDHGKLLGKYELLNDQNKRK
jgi:chromosome segregation ATPase